MKASHHPKPEGTSNYHLFFDAHFMWSSSTSNYTKIWLSAFLTATILPLSSELVLTDLLRTGESPFAVIIIATLGNVLGIGALIPYYINRFKLTQQQTDKAERQFNPYDKWSLLIARPIRRQMQSTTKSSHWFEKLKTIVTCLGFICYS